MVYGDHLVFKDYIADFTLYFLTIKQLPFRGSFFLYRYHKRCSTSLIIPYLPFCYQTLVPCHLMLKKRLHAAHSPDVRF